MLRRYKEHHINMLLYSINDKARGTIRFLLLHSYASGKTAVFYAKEIQNEEPLFSGSLY